MADAPSATHSPLAGARQRSYHLIVYGATGYSGRLVCREVCKLLQDPVMAPVSSVSVMEGNSRGGSASTFRWGMAGRNRNALEEVLNALKADFPDNSGNILPTGVFTADTNDAGGMMQLAKEAEILLNCAGPYALCGRAVVDACLKAYTHYLDITGEPSFLIKDVWPLHQEAIQRGIFLVPCCGFDCVPSELGTYRVLETRQRSRAASLTAANVSRVGPPLSPSVSPSPASLASGSNPPTPRLDQVKGDQAPADSSTKCVVDAVVHYGGSLSNGTFYTLLNSLRQAYEGGATRNRSKEGTKAAAGGAGSDQGRNSSGQTAIQPAAVAQPLVLPRARQAGPGYNKTVKGWVVSLPSADPSLISRSYAVGAQNERQPVLAALSGYRHWLGFPGFFSWLKRVLLLTIFLQLAKIRAGRRFLAWWRGSGEKQHLGPSAVERSKCGCQLLITATEVQPITSAQKSPVASLTSATATVNTTHMYDVTASAAVLSVFCLSKWLQIQRLRRGESRPSEAATPTGGAWTLVTLLTRLELAPEERTRDLVLVHRDNLRQSDSVGTEASLIDQGVTMLDEFEAKMNRCGALTVTTQAHRVASHSDLRASL